ncbi:hypothetical protein C8R48DRAFT_395960 [Suillus tomentosus]|nr:hypothetical protein C8R48DRAFT_395960 [Suillus tomentosus]
MIDLLPYQFPSGSSHSTKPLIIIFCLRRISHHLRRVILRQQQRHGVRKTSLRGNHEVTAVCQSLCLGLQRLAHQNESQVYYPVLDDNLLEEFNRGNTDWRWSMSRRDYFT